MQEGREKIAAKELIQKRLYIKTYGCGMNEYDSRRMADLLRPHGFIAVNSPEDADMVILNTCHIREKATEKVYSELGRIAKVKEDKGGDLIVTVAGCTAQAEGEEVVRRAPIVDIVVGPQSYHDLPILVEEVKRKKKWVTELSFTENDKFDSIMDMLRDQVEKGEKPISSVSAFLSIQEGCDKFCHFCCVPYTRGAEYSRSIEDVHLEATHMVKGGAKEIYLLGQNVSAYKGIAPVGLSSDRGDDSDKRWGLDKLISQVAAIDGVHRIRYTTSHPMDMKDEGLFSIHADEPKLMPYLHLPAQSGSDRILKLMNRKYSAKEYVEIIEKYRRYRSDIAISSDFIVGYPGETEEDFEDTMELVRTVNYAQAYSFKYSPRPGTPAATLADQVPEEAKSERLLRLQELLRKQQTDFNRGMIGKSLEVLIERIGRFPQQVIGRSPYLQSVVINSDSSERAAAMIGQLVEVTVVAATQSSLLGIAQ